VAERLAFFTGLGLVIVAISSVAFGRLTIVGAREAQMAASRAPAPAEQPATASTATTQRLPRRIPLGRPVTTPKTPEETSSEGQRTNVFRRLVSARSSSGGDEES
jgi:hypothetical protein